MKQPTWVRNGHFLLFCGLMLFQPSFLPAAQNDILTCHFVTAGRPGKQKKVLMVTQAQWNRVKAILLSGDSKQIATLISESGLLMRTTPARVKILGFRTTRYSKSEFLALIHEKIYDATRKKHPLSGYKTLVSSLKQRNCERRRAGDHWEVGSKDEQNNHYPDGRVVFFCENGRLKIKLIASRQDSPSGYAG